MSLRTRLALAFALVALLTAAAVVLAAPAIVGRGFAAALAGETPGRGPGAGQGGGGLGQGAGAGQGQHWQRVQQDTVVALVVVALAAAGGATMLGILIAQRTTRPLARLEAAADAVARGDLTARSGLGDRRDEIGSLARTFDGMTEELAGQEAARRRFFADVGHELKTPLAVIDATTSAVLDGVYAHDDRHLETIRDQARQLTRIVDDLRTVSLADAGALPLRPEAVPVEPVLDALARDLRLRSPETTVEVTAAAGTPPALADPDRLRQVIAALGDNALHHGARGTWIRLSAARGEDRGGGTRPGPTVVIAVADGGPGIAEADRPHVFDRFYQADVARDRATGTSGLGLAISRAIVEAMGGRISVDADSAGGARFTVVLPAA
ncbi:MAG TPA: HAMP domain-containing sensor histidine kinase [Candidatus Limnocylindrales bacterium]|nr:HAMP domain-containing sensor histidine kinase [Candidatus Limnocylindrales bacterium]